MERASEQLPRLRTDLGTIVSGVGSRAHRVVVDEISGRFSRVSDRVWKLLKSNEAEPSMWQEATTAGWVRERTKAAKVPFSILSIRVSLGSIDRFATWLAPRTGWLFSAQAVLVWGCFVFASLLVFLSSREQWAAAVYSIPKFLQQVNPVALAGIFVCTKLVHECAHAIVCRRVGARCGDVGVLVLCGMPCPYCDVTDVWRVPNAASRCAVMFAGIYVELVIAAFSVFGWVLSHDPAWQLFFVYVMLVCGVSTLLFNANPLMRYDGYYILSDLVGTTNLRTLSREAWLRLVVRVVGGPGDGRTFAQSLRTYAFAFYHVLASMYRVLIAVAITSLVIQWSSYINLRPVAVVLVVLAMASSGNQMTRRLVGVVQGTGMWSKFPRWRRVASVGTLVVIVASLIFVPFPRYRRVEGRVEASEVVVAYVTNGGIVDTVDAEVGAIVEAGQRLATIRNPEVQFETLRLEGQLRLASLRRQASERSALDRPEASRQWEILRAAESATVTSVDSARLKEQHNAIVASVGGMVLPPVLRAKQRELSPAEPNSGSLPSHLNSVEHLASLDGLGVESDDEWCRISPSRARRVLFHLSSEDFQHVNILDKLRVRETVFMTRKLSPSLQLFEMRNQ
jgi:putative peptide zinc metalloprotease protein